MTEPLPFKVKQTTDLERWRVETFWTKEPETIAWIDSFEPEQLFLDVGANIGLYSLYAAATRNVRVVGVEPHPNNWLAFMTNIRLGRLKGKITPLRALAQEKNQMEHFFCGDLQAGYSGTGRGANATAVFPQDYKNPVPGFTVDWLTDAFGFFQHIKIDVDGEELRVLDGMHYNFIGRLFETCLIEVEFENRDLVIKLFEENLYTLDNEFNKFKPHSRERRAREGIQVENLIFTKS
jgi:FkbM family methyltransferase